MNTLPDKTKLDNNEIILSVDLEKARQCSFEERQNGTTALFLALTNAINNGYSVDMTNLQNIRISKK